MQTQVIGVFIFDSYPTDEADAEDFAITIHSVTEVDDYKHNCMSANLAWLI